MICIFILCNCNVRGCSARFELMIDLNQQRKHSTVCRSVSGLNMFATITEMAVRACVRMTDQLILHFSEVLIEHLIVSTGHVH